MDHHEFGLRRALRVAPALLLLSSLSPADNDLITALANGTFGLEFRYRIETVDQDAFGRDAEASTLRTRLNYHSDTFTGFSLFFEADNISDVFWDDYNSTRNGNTQFPVVADPTGTSVNQAWLDYRGWDGQRLAFGRQRINLDNQRFIGGVGWRQNEQTYDAFRWTVSAWEPLTLRYGYINRVQRIFGPDDGNPTDTFDSDSHFINLAVQDLPFGQLTGYGYWLDLENADVLSNATYGLRLSGDTEMAGLATDYQAEFAHQEDYGDNPVNYSANYLLLDGGLSHRGWRGGIGYELLEGDDNLAGAAFRTPLATLHKFQGWTDQFLVTPDDGIEDLYFNLGTRVHSIDLKLVYHRFEAESGSRDFGSEWGIQATRGFDKYGTVLVKFASYSADQFSTDTDKLWLQYSIGFD